jgi:hypothetical protein
METTLFGMSSAPSSTGVAVAELQKNFGDATAVFSAGQVLESDAVLGMVGTGALGVSTHSTTSFISVAASKPLSAGTTVSAMVSIGNTAGYDNQAASLIDGASASQSAAWSLGLSRADMWQRGDSLGLSLAMPLRTMSGSMQVTTATAQSQLDGSLTYTTQALALSPSGMEKDLELAYARTAVFGGRLSAMAQVRFEPGHDAQAQTQLAAGLKFLKSF